jgi:hypothetical protein
MADDTLVPSSDRFIMCFLALAFETLFAWMAFLWPLDWLKDLAMGALFGFWLSHYKASFTKTRAGKVGTFLAAFLEALPFISVFPWWTIRIWFASGQKKPIAEDGGDENSSGEGS